MGMGFFNAMLMIAAPIMAGGLGLGALPMSEMYAAKTGTDSAAFMGDLLSAVVLANVVCILIAGLYNGLGKNRRQSCSWASTATANCCASRARPANCMRPPKRDASSYIALGKGLAIASVLFVFGELMGSFLEVLHPYAWTIIAAAALKIFGLLPKGPRGLHLRLGRDGRLGAGARPAGRRLHHLHQDRRGPRPRWATRCSSC